MRLRADGGVEAEGGDAGEGESDDERGVTWPFPKAEGPGKQQDDGGGDEEGEGEPDRFRGAGKVEPLAEGFKGNHARTGGQDHAGGFLAVIARDESEDVSRHHDKRDVDDQSGKSRGASPCHGGSG